MGRVRVLQSTVLVMSGIGIFFSALGVVFGFNQVLVGLPFVFMIGVLIFATTAVRKLPPGFLSEKGVSIQSLVKFQFGKKIESVFKDSFFEADTRFMLRIK